MKKLINRPEDVLQEALAGFARAHGDLITYQPEGRFVRRKHPTPPGKVALVSGGGSGHEPLHLGFVGEGMLDAACPGEIFTSPTPDQMMAAAETVDSGAGVLFIVKNYSGDVMNFEMAAEMTQVTTETVLVSDDVAVLDSTHTQGRRGVAGTVIVEKLVGAAAERGDDLGRCRQLAETVNANTATMAVALSSCTVPAAGTPTFSLAEDEIELGVGIHGEPGRRRESAVPANEIARQLVEAVCEDLKPTPGESLLLLCNGLGGTPLIELYLMFHAAAQELDKRNLTLSRTLVGNYCTSLEMAGASITLSRLDAESLALWDAPVVTPALRWGK